MDPNTSLLASILLIGIIALIGFFITKTKGFARFATSTFLLVVIVVLSALLFAAGKLDGEVLANIFFAVIGFAGGLFTGKDSKEKQGASGTNSQK